jgi:hypothetical protein
MRDPRPPCSRLLLAALLALALPSGAARAQHGMAAGPRPLHLRLAAADVVALATVEAVGEARVSLRDATVLHGEAPPAFELKRAPSKQIPYAVGVTLLLPLRGARSPYVLVDDARELVVIRDDASAAAFRAAIPALLAAGDDPALLLATYLDWLDRGEEELREAAAAALLDPRAALLPVPAERALERAAAALDPGLPVPARRVSARLATSRAEGASALLGPALRDPAADPQVVETALRGAALWDAPGLDDALLAGLAHGSPAVRRATVKLVETTGSAAALARLPALAGEDPDLGVRREAEKVLSAKGLLGAPSRGEP